MNQLKERIKYHTTIKPKRKILTQGKNSYTMNISNMDMIQQISYKSLKDKIKDP